MKDKMFKGKYLYGVIDPVCQEKKVHPMHLLSGSVSGTLEFPWLKDSNDVALLTGANSQCEITTCHCDHLLSINNKTHCRLYKTCQGPIEMPLFALVFKKCSGANSASVLFSPLFSSKCS